MGFCVQLDCSNWTQKYSKEFNRGLIEDNKNNKTTEDYEIFSAKIKSIKFCQTTENYFDDSMNKYYSSKFFITGEGDKDNYVLYLKMAWEAGNHPAPDIQVQYFIYSVDEFFISSMASPYKKVVFVVEGTTTIVKYE